MNHEAHVCIRFTSGVGDWPEFWNVPRAAISGQSCVIFPMRGLFISLLHVQLSLKKVNFANGESMHSEFSIHYMPSLPNSEVMNLNNQHF